MLPIRASESNTSFDYTLNPDPYPVEASIYNSPLTVTPEEFATSSLVLMITNPGSIELAFHEVVVQIPVGSQTGDLTEFPDQIQCYVSEASYSCAQQPSAASGTVAIGITNNGTGILAGGESMYVQIFSIVVNTESGVVDVGIVEQLEGQPGTNTATLQVMKLPAGFYFANLQVQQNNAGVAQVAYNSSVDLVWDTSVVDLSVVTFTVYFTGPAGEQPSPVTTAGFWSSPALTSDTVFTVEATITPFSGVPMSLWLSTSVSVAYPDLTASSVTVTSLAGGSGNITAQSMSAYLIGAPSGAIVHPSSAFSMIQAPTSLPVPASGNLVTYSTSTDGFVIVNVVPTAGAGAGWASVVGTVYAPPVYGPKGHVDPLIPWYTLTTNGINSAATGTTSDCTTGFMLLPLCALAVVTLSVLTSGIAPAITMLFMASGSGSISQPPT